MNAAHHDASDTRAAEWRAQLHALIADRLATPFAWGVHDCCLWAADAVQAQTGTDPAAEFRGSYADAAGAARLVRGLGGLAAIGARGGEPIAPLMAQEGDVGLVVGEGRELLAVCSGPHWLAPGAGGLTVLPLQAATHAWRVSRG